MSLNAGGVTNVIISTGVQNSQVAIFRVPLLLADKITLFIYEKSQHNRWKAISDGISFSIDNLRTLGGIAISFRMSSPRDTEWCPIELHGTAKNVVCIGSSGARTVGLLL